jgi:uncharacterized protein YqgV (UPF0045/DUF77 family)
MMVLAQVSLYPIEALDADEVINASIAELAGQVDHSVGPVSTELRGETDEVFDALRRLFDRACEDGGEVSMVATVTNARL